MNIKSLTRAFGAKLQKWLVYAVAKTCTWEFVGVDKSRAYIEAMDRPYILVAPHESVLSVIALMLADWPFKGVAVISTHTTVHWLYKVIESKGVDLILIDKHKPSADTSQKIKAALAENKPILITPDGPLGPAHHYDPGVWLMARRYKVPVLCLSCFWTRSVRLGNWDRHQVPLPFTKCVISGEDPIWVDKSFAGVSEEDVNSGHVDPSHPAVALPRRYLSKVAQLERQYFGYNQ